MAGDVPVWPDNMAQVAVLDDNLQPVVASTAFPYFPSLPPRTRTCPASDRFRPSTQKKTGSSLRLPGFCKRKIITPVCGGKCHDITERLVAEVIHPAV